jgi:hypothetical protein
MVWDTFLGDFFHKLIWGRFFVHFFLGKFSGKFSPTKMLGKIAIFRGKSFEKSFFQQIPRNFPRKITFHGKKCTKNWPLVNLSRRKLSCTKLPLGAFRYLHPATFFLCSYLFVPRYVVVLMIGADS